MGTGRALAVAAVLGGALLVSTRPLPAPLPRPVIYATDSEARAAMRSAPVIVVVRISDVALTGDERMVPKPPEVGGPMRPAIPLSLARIQADVLLTVRGPARKSIEFYSWIWTSGSHGGPRLFHPDPGRYRALFLREEAGLLHTVGDYPSYDLVLWEEWLPAILRGWEAGDLLGFEPPDRLVSLRLRAELEPLTLAGLRDSSGHRDHLTGYQSLDIDYDLARLSGPLFVARQLDDLCLHSTNPATRFVACLVTAESIPGRCHAFELALQADPGTPDAVLLRQLAARCPQHIRWDLQELRSHPAGRYANYLLGSSPADRREALRVYASGFDEEVRRAACALAAAEPEIRPLPECPAPDTAPRLD